MQVRLKESPSPYLGSKELSYCALRTQLLMSLHDSSLKGPSGKKASGVWKEKDFLTKVTSLIGQSEPACIHQYPSHS